jgi:alpha-glucosidase
MNLDIVAERRIMRILNWTILFLLVWGTTPGFSQGNPQQSRDQRTRRLQRVVPMKPIDVTSPDGGIKFSLLPNAERLTFTVTMAGVAILDPSPIVMKVDGFDLSSGVVFDSLETYKLDETYPWLGAHSIAKSTCNGVRVSMLHDLSFTRFVLEVRVFNDGVAFRHVIPGDDSLSRIPDEYTTFVVPNGSTAWYHDMDGHYEADYIQKEMVDVPVGQ